MRGSLPEGNGELVMGDGRHSVAKASAIVVPVRGVLLASFVATAMLALAVWGRPPYWYFSLLRAYVA